MYVPGNVEWFIAEQIQQFCVEGKDTSLVWINSILVKANNSEQAYVRALELGNQSEHEYDNPEGKRVRVRFIGLRDLYPIHDRLEDGAELFYESMEDLNESEVKALSKGKNELELFLE